MQICVSTAMESDARSLREAQARFHLLLIGVDVFLKFARQEFAHLGVQPVHIGDQRQQRQQETAAG